MGKAGDPFWINRFLGCGTMVGGTGDSNHSATGRFLVFSLAMSPFHEFFRLPLLRGFYSQYWVFVQKEASVSPVRERWVSPVRERFWGGRHYFGPPKTTEAMARKGPKTFFVDSSGVYSGCGAMFLGNTLVWVQKCPLSSHTTTSSPKREKKRPPF